MFPKMLEGMEDQLGLIVVGGNVPQPRRLGEFQWGRLEKTETALGVSKAFANCGKARVRKFHSDYFKRFVHLAISAFTLEIDGAPGFVLAARAVSSENTSFASGP